jgi:HAD superfamily hydrolase (TIGR01509 family)
MKLKAAIFDMDGVLFDTERVFQQTWQELAKERGIVLDEGFVRSICGTSGAQIEHVVERYYHVESGAGIVRECKSRVRQKLMEKVPVKEGVPEILAKYKKEGLKMAIASSSTVEQIESNLRLSGLADYFDRIVSGDQVEHGKPEPDIFLAAAVALGFRPEECYVFEDSENGVIAGYRAGCHVVMMIDLIEPGEKTAGCCSEIHTSFLQML